MKKRILAFIMALCCAVNLGACGKSVKQLTSLELSAQAKTTETEMELAGQWYGYWIISDCSDQWKALEGKSWDCCAEVTISGDKIELLLWDEDMAKNNYLAKLLVEKSGNGYSCTGGDFLDISILSGQTSVRITDSSGQLLTISGKYEDSRTGNFYYTFYMRPWGESWPESGRTPSYYQDWYLPRIQAGESAPDEINNK